MKKRIMIIVLAVVFAFPMVVEAHGIQKKVTSSRYEIGQLDAEIVEEYISDSISEKVIDLIEAGKPFEVSEAVEAENYEYYVISIPKEETQMVVGYYKKDSNIYEMIELSSQTVMTEQQILSYFNE